MNLTGKLISKSETAQISESFKKREFVIEYAENPQYPEFVKFELVQDKCNIIDGLKKDQEIDVHFNIKGRKWEKDGKTSYFNSLQAWKIDPNNEANRLKDNHVEEVAQGMPVEENLDLPF